MSNEQTHAQVVDDALGKLDALIAAEQRGLAELADLRRQIDEARALLAESADLPAVVTVLERQIVGMEQVYQMRGQSLQERINKALALKRELEQEWRQTPSVRAAPAEPQTTSQSRGEPARLTGPRR